MVTNTKLQSKPNCHCEESLKGSTKQSTMQRWMNGLLRCTRNDEKSHTLIANLYKYYKLTFISFLIAAAFSQNVYGYYFMPVQYCPVITWENLNLSENQSAKIRVLDLRWQKTRMDLTTQIICDKERLKLMLTNPYASDRAIRDLQNKVLINQKQLRYKAMENFLLKRNVLNRFQRERLHQMLN